MKSLCQVNVKITSETKPQQHVNKDNTNTAQSNLRMTKPRPGEATALGKVCKWFQQPNSATSLQETQILQVTQRSYFTSCCCRGGTKTLHQPQRKILLPLFSKEKRGSEVSLIQHRLLESALQSAHLSRS